MSWIAWIFGLSTLVGVVGWWNWRTWQGDRQQAAKLRAAGSVLPELPESPSPLISFLIPAWNAQNTIQRCIEAVLELPYPNLEVVVCAGGQDGTYQIAESYQGEKVQVLSQQPGEGKQRSLQRCLDVSHGEIIYLIDADCVIQAGNFTRTIYPILVEKEQAVSGSFYMPLEEQRDIPFVISQVSSAAYAAARHTGDSSEGLLGGNCAMTRLALEMAGEFQNPVFTGTDYDLALRLRHNNVNIRYIVLGWIKSEYQTRYRSYIRQQARWIRNVFIHGKHGNDHPLVQKFLRTSIFGLIMIILPLISLGLITLDKLGLLLASLTALAWIALFFYTFFSRLRYLSFGKLWIDLDFRNTYFILIPIYILLDYFTWIIPLFEFQNKSLRQRW